MNEQIIFLALSIGSSTLHYLNGSSKCIQILTTEWKKTCFGINNNSIKHSHDRLSILGEMYK